MFRLRAIQMQAFADAQRRDFVRRMRDHLAEIFPAQWNSITPSKQREMLEHGLVCASDYGLREEYEVCLYLYVMMILGKDFDRDPAQRSLRTILTEDRLGPRDRIEQCFHIASNATRSAQ